MSTIRIIKSDITKVKADAVVNAANEYLAAGGGVCGAIFEAAGHADLEKACRKIGHCDTGSAVITPAFQLDARYIIHAVGPRWAGGRNGEAEKLRSAYLSSLTLAREYNCASTAFPLISAGIFGYPEEEAWEIAINACRAFLGAHTDYQMDIIFAVRTDEKLEMGKRYLEKA